MLIRFITNEDELMWLSLKLICSQVALGFAFALLSLAPGPAFAQSPTTNQPWAYLLLNDSSLTDDCLICLRPTIQELMRGTFRLRLLEANVLAARYALEDVQFTAGNRPASPRILFTQP